MRLSGNYHSNIFESHLDPQKWSYTLHFIMKFLHVLLDFIEGIDFFFTII